MDRKIEIQVINICNSPDTIGAYSITLQEIDGLRSITITVGPTEAQSIALYLRKIAPPRPLTHDLTATILAALDVNVIRTLIYKVQNGIFYSYIYLKRDNEIIRIDARTSDAIAVAIRTQCPILIYDSILAQKSLYKKDTQPASKPYEQTKLKSILEKAIKEENYELAAQIRDQLNSMKNGDK